MNDVPVRVSAFPVREGIGAEPRVNKGYGTDKIGVGKVWEVRIELVRHQHALVNHGLVRQTWQVKIFAALKLPAVTNFVFTAFTNHIQFAFKSHWVGDARVAGDEHGSHFRLDPFCRVAQCGIFDRHRTPTDYALTFGSDDVLKLNLERPTVCWVGWHVNHANAVLAWFGQGEAASSDFLLQECVRNLYQNACTITRVFFCASSTTVG